MKWVIAICTLCILFLSLPVVSAIPISNCQTFTGDNGYYTLDRDLTLSTASGCFHFGYGQNNVLDLGGHTILYDDWPASDVQNPSFEDGTGSVADHWVFTNAPTAVRSENRRFSHVGENYTLVFPRNSVPQYVETEPIPVTAGRTYRANMLYYGDNARIYMDINGVCNNRVNARPAPNGAAYYYFCDYTPSSSENIVIRIGMSSSPASQTSVDLVNFAPVGSSLITSQGGSGGLQITNGTIIQGSGKSWGGNAVNVASIGAATQGGTTSVNNLNITNTGVGTTPIFVGNGDGGEIHNNIVSHTRNYHWHREWITPMIGFAGVGMHVFNNTVLNAFQTGIRGSGAAADYFIHDNYVLMNNRITNGYGIEGYGTPGVNIYRNVIRGTGRGIHVEGRDGANIYENDIEMMEYLNPEYPDINGEGMTGNCAHGIKNEGQSNSHIYNNVVMVHGYDDTYMPCPLNVGAPTNGNVLVENNVLTAVSHDPLPSIRPSPQAVFITGTNGGVTIRNNTFISNRRGVTLFYDINGLYFEGNTFINSEPGNGIYHALNIMEGEYTHFLNGLFYNNTLLNGSNLSDVEIASSAAFDGDYEIRYPVTVLVKDNVGTFLSPADITIRRNRDNQIVYSQTTNTGQASTDLPETFVQILTNGNFADNYDAPYTVEVNYGGDVKTYPIQLHQEEVVEAIYDFSGIQVSNILCNVGSGMQDCSNIQYGSQLIGVQAICTDDGSITGARVVVTHEESSTELVNQLYSYSNGDEYVFDITPGQTITDSGTIRVTVSCDDNSGFTAANFASSTIPFGTLTSEVLQPAQTPSYVQDGNTFTFQTRLTCNNGDCGDVISTLDPFDDSAWRVAYQETFDSPTTLTHNTPFGTDGWLTPQLENGGAITIPGDGLAYVSTPDFWNAALIHSTNVLPEDWKIRVRMGNVNYEWENYDAVDRANPNFYNQDENGIYLITVTNALCAGLQCAEAWWHDHRKSVIDIDDHPGAEHPVYMVWLDPGFAPWGGNGLHTWNGNSWSPLHNWDTAYTYQLNTYYIAEMEKDQNNLILRLYDSSENILEETTTVAWDGVAYTDVPEYFYTGEPHTDDYKGSAVIDDITLLVPLQQAKGGVVPVGSGSPFFTNINPQTCTNLQGGQTCTQTWQVTTNTPNGQYNFFVIHDALHSSVAGINSPTYVVNVTTGPVCPELYDVSNPCDCVDTFELGNAITGWYSDIIRINQLMQHIRSWKSCP